MIPFRTLASLHPCSQFLQDSTITRSIQDFHRHASPFNGQFDDPNTSKQNMFIFMWILHGFSMEVALRLQKKTHPLSPVPQQFQAWHCWLMLSPHASTCQPNGYRGAIGRWKNMSSPNPRIETNKTGSKLNLSSSQFQSSHKPRRRSRIDIHRYPSISHLS